MADGGPSRKRAASPGVTLEVEIVRHGDAWAGEITDALLEPGRARRVRRRAVPAARDLSRHSGPHR